MKEFNIRKFLTESDNRFSRKRTGQVREDDYDNYDQYGEINNYGDADGSGEYRDGGPYDIDGRPKDGATGIRPGPRGSGWEDAQEEEDFGFEDSDFGSQDEYDADQLRQHPTALRLIDLGRSDHSTALFIMKGLLKQLDDKTIQDIGADLYWYEDGGILDGVSDR